jgi:hypothetical protein
MSLKTKLFEIFVRIFSNVLRRAIIIGCTVAFVGSAFDAVGIPGWINVILLGFGAFVAVYAVDRNLEHRDD